MATGYGPASRTSRKLITRRRFSEIVGGAVASVGVLGCETTRRSAPAGAPARKEDSITGSHAPHNPNILIIHCDELRVDCLGAYGNREIQTPHVDALAADGVRFENHFCSYPVCTPSRYSLLSGLPVHDHQGWSNYCTLPPGTETIPGLLKNVGYRTAAAGKMHFTPTYLDVGFERMVLAEQDGPGRWDDDYHRDLRAAGLIDVNDIEDQRSEYRRKAPREYWENCGALPSNLPREWHSTEWVARHALREIDGWGAGGNMLMAGFVKPHHPFDPPKELCDLYDPEKISLLAGWTPECLPHDLETNKGYFPNAGLTEPIMRRVTAYYYATIHHIDIQVGRIVELLKRKGIYDDTLIVFTADHGDNMGYHHMLLKGSYMYEPMAKIPLIIKYPRSRDKGTVYTGLTINTDVAPTLLRQAGVAPGARMAGIDLARDRNGRSLVYGEAALGKEFMVRSDRYKLIQDRKRQRSFFYDLKKDPYELVNCYGDTTHRSQIAPLEKALNAWAANVHEPKAFLDENAPEIPQPNVPKKNNGHREAMIAYSQEKVSEYRRVAK
ncbi:MAG: sulfatase-like hydrolase/transferase [Candidatus Hydrogenedentes bacterium]|nr:sulfatase-like hydrolase/transferase [Candidatus Hydrogenedentota bacterium]